MTDLCSQVEQAFSAQGALARGLTGFVPREGQLRLALEVACAIEEREPLVAEAGTGVGKTFAYLVPALLSGQRVLVSTATKGLQDQLFLRDLPRLCEVLGVPAKTALLKGRSSYLCVYRLKRARHSGAALDAWATRSLARVERWALQTVAGDLAELDEVDERSPVIPLVTSTKDNCLGSECEEYANCHVVHARRDAMAADVVVVNHHLFFADLALRDTGVAELLPTADVVIFDEAHQLTETGVQFLGMQLGSAQLLEFSRDLLALGLQHARGLGPWRELAAHLESQVKALRLACLGGRQEVRGGFKLNWAERSQSGDASLSFDLALQAVAEALQQAFDAMEPVLGSSVEWVRLQSRGQSLRQSMDAFLQRAPDEAVRWIEVSAAQCRMVESPLDVRQLFEQQVASAPKAWVFTSATLGDDDSLSWFTGSAGLEEARVFRAPSPFDYENNARLYVPSGLPPVSAATHPAAVAALAFRFARMLGGRTFILTTTLRALASIGDELRRLLAEQGEAIQVLQQGQGSKRQLLASFHTASGRALTCPEMPCNASSSTSCHSHPRKTLWSRRAHSGSLHKGAAHLPTISCPRPRWLSSKGRAV
jgi:ATP-dependent DNA helicase DinG